MYFLALLLAFGLPQQQAAPQQSAASPAARSAAALMRTLNTMEATYRYSSNTGHFADMQELAGFWAQHHPKDRPAQLTADVLEGYVVRVGRSGDGYLISIMPKEPKDCQTGFYSDETGVIHRTVALGCEEKK